MTGAQQFLLWGTGIIGLVVVLVTFASAWSSRGDSRAEYQRELRRTAEAELELLRRRAAATELTDTDTDRGDRR